MPNPAVPLSCSQQPVAKVWLHSTGDASPLAALLLAQILPVFSVVAPCHRGASPVSVRRQTFTTSCRNGGDGGNGTIPLCSSPFLCLLCVIPFPPYTPLTMLQITGTIAIDDREIEERFVRASGPGGQNVNKVSTAVELRFDVRASSLPFDVKDRLLALAANRITADGVLLIDSREHRTQARNREAARQRLVAL